RDVSTRGPLFEWNNGEGAWGVAFYIDPHWSNNEFRPGALFANITATTFKWHLMITDAGVVVPDRFQYVALTYDQASGEAIIYRDGELVAQEQFGQFTPQTSYDLYLGRRVSGMVASEDYKFGGRLDEPVIFNRALSQSEIRTLYEAGRSGRTVLIPARVP